MQPRERRLHVRIGEKSVLFGSDQAMYRKGLCGLQTTSLGGGVVREQPAMRIPDATADCGDQKQGHYGAHESVCVHGARMMTSSDDDIKTAVAIEWASPVTGLYESKA